MTSEGKHVTGLFASVTCMVLLVCSAMSVAAEGVSPYWLNGMGPINTQWQWNTGRNEQYINLKSNKGTWVWTYNDPGGSGVLSILYVGRTTVRPSQWWSTGYPNPATANENAIYSSATGTPIMSSLANNERGVWIVAFSALVGLSDDYDIFMSRSTDDGITWSAAVHLDTRGATDTFPDDRPNIIFEPSARIFWCTWLSAQPVAQNGQNNLNNDVDVAVANSTDDTGSSWYPARWVNPDFGTAWVSEVYPKLFLGSPPGTLHISYAGQPIQYAGFTSTSTNDIVVLTKNATAWQWSNARGLNSEQGSLTTSNEQYPTDVASDGNNVVFAYLRQNTTPWSMDLLVSVSRDGGWTFSSPMALEVNVNTDKGVSVTSDGLGAFTIFWASGRYSYTLPGTSSPIQISLGSDREIFYSVLTFENATASGVKTSLARPVDFVNLFIPSPSSDNGDSYMPAAWVDYESGDAAVIFLSSKRNYKLNGTVWYTGQQEYNVMGSAWIARNTELCAVNSVGIPAYCHANLVGLVANAPTGAVGFTDIKIASVISPNGSITITGGRQVSLSAAYAKNVNRFEVAALFPSFIMGDSTSALRFITSSNLALSGGAALVRNDGEATQLFIATGSYAGFACPLGFTVPANLSNWCTPCPTGIVCSNAGLVSPGPSCAVGRYCPLGTYDESVFKCRTHRHYNTGGFTTKSDCVSNGQACDPGYLCPPGALTSQYSILLNVSQVTFDTTVVFPSDVESPFTVTMLANAFVSDVAGTNTITLYDDRVTDSNFPKWLDVSGNFIVPTPGASSATSTMLTNTIESKVDGVSISDTLFYTYNLRYKSAATGEDLGVPITLSYSRSVTTVVFNPEEGIIERVSVYSDPFIKELLIFNIGCDSSLNWTATIVNCSNPAIPLDWVSTTDTSGLIARGSVDPGIIKLDINLTDSIQPGGQLANLIADSIASSGDQIQAGSVLGSRGTFLAEACVDVRFRLIVTNSSLNNTGGELKKVAPIQITLFETCPPGRFSLTGSSEEGACDPCPAGTYAPDRGTTLCRACPEATPRTEPGAASVSECKTAPGSYLDVDGSVIRCDTLGPGVECLTEGITLQTIRIKPGYWRSSNTSKTIMKCINPPFCKGNLVGMSSGNGSYSLGGGRRRRLVDAQLDSEYCIEHHLGPLCEGCEAGFVRRGLSVCTLCDADAYSGDKLRLGWTIFAAVLIVFLAFLVVQWGALVSFVKKRRETIMAVPRRISTIAFSSKQTSRVTQSASSPARPKSRRTPGELIRTMSVRVRAKTKIDKRMNFLWGIVVSIEASVTLRILLSLFQVTSGVSKTFYDLLPPTFHSIAAAFNVVSAELFYRIDFGCIIKSNHNLSLILSMAAPVVLTIIILLIHLIMEHRLRVQRRLSDVQKLRNGTYSIFLGLLFLVYPGVSNTILSTYACREFDGGLRFLRKDLTVNCDAADRHVWLVLAGFGVVLYVIGVPLFYAQALFKVRKYLNPKEGTPDPVNFPHVTFLVSIYKPRFYWWEVVETLRKLCQTSLVVFIVDGSLLQAIFMVAFTMLMVVLINELKPYVSDDANRLAYTAQVQILIISFLTVLYKADLSEIDRAVMYDKKAMLDSCIITACFIAPVLAIWQSRRALLKFARFIVNKTRKNLCCGKLSTPREARLTVSSKIVEGDEVEAESLGDKRISSTYTDFPHDAQSFVALNGTDRPGSKDSDGASPV